MGVYKDLAKSVENVIEKARIVCGTNDLIELAVAKNELNRAIKEVEPLNFVMADNLAQYFGWVKAHNLNPNQYRYLYNDMSLAGARNPNVYLIGDYIDNPIYSSRFLHTSEAHLILGAQ